MSGVNGNGHSSGASSQKYGSVLLSSTPTPVGEVGCSAQGDTPQGRYESNILIFFAGAATSLRS